MDVRDQLTVAAACCIAEAKQCHREGRHELEAALISSAAGLAAAIAGLGSVKAVKWYRAEVEKGRKFIVQMMEAEGSWPE